MLPAYGQQEAPAGLDNQTIETFQDAQDQHDKDRKFFDEVEQITPDGLGPIYNAQSCRECHQNGGLNTPAGVVTDGVSGAGSQVVEQRFGRIVGGKFVDPSIEIEGDLIVGRTLVNDRAICQRAQERVPDLPDNLVEGVDFVRTNRLALNVLGDGFIEAVPDETLLGIRDQQCSLGKGICGVVIWVPLLEAPGAANARIGRFGWKDQHASLLSFAADAYLNEMGVTNRLQKDEVTQVCNPPVSQANPPPQGTVTEPNSLPNPNDTDANGRALEDIDHFARFMRATKVPPRDALLAGTAAVQHGEEVFKQVGCDVCHIQNMKTGAKGQSLNGGMLTISDALGDQIFHPYSDFLLHDVGTGDGIAIATVEHYGREIAAELNAHDAQQMQRSPNAAVDPIAVPAIDKQAAATLFNAPKTPELRPFFQQDQCTSGTLAADRNERQPTTTLFYRNIQCTANRLRTPPLWGLHMRTRLMHDGNSVQIRDAIRRHKGEAAATTARFNSLSEADKQDLIKFLNSL